MSTGLGVAAIIWIAAIAIYFTVTTRAQRQAALLIIWGLMLLPALYYAARLAFT